MVNAHIILSDYPQVQFDTECEIESVDSSYLNVLFLHSYRVGKQRLNLDNRRVDIEVMNDERCYTVSRCLITEKVFEVDNVKQICYTIGYPLKIVNRRGSYRVGCTYKGIIQKGDHRGTIDITIRDISLTGIGAYVKTESTPKMGTECSIAIAVKSSYLKIVGTVVRVEEVNEEMSCVGFVIKGSSHRAYDDFVMSEQRKERERLAGKA